MAATTVARTPAPAATASVEPAPSAQVLVWGGLGLVSLAVITWGWGHWLFSSDLRAAPAGPDAFGGVKLVFATDDKQLALAARASGLAVTGL